MEAERVPHRSWCQAVAGRSYFARSAAVQRQGPSGRSLLFSGYGASGGETRVPDRRAGVTAGLSLAALFQTNNIAGCRGDVVAADKWIWRAVIYEMSRRFP
jgi:hypothetical protein